MLSANAVNSTEIFESVVTSEDPAEAALIANTITYILPGKISNVVEGSSVRVVDYAVTPATRYSPSLTRFATIGLAIGMLLSCAIIVLIEIFDEEIHSEDYLLQNFSQPVLAVIPDLLLHESASGYYSGYHTPHQSE